MDRTLRIQLHVNKNADIDYGQLAYVLLVFAKNVTRKPGKHRAVTAIEGDGATPPWFFTDYRIDKEEPLS